MIYMLKIWLMHISFSAGCFWSLETTLLIGNLQDKYAVELEILEISTRSLKTTLQNENI